MKGSWPLLYEKIKFNLFILFRMILKDIDLAMSFKNIMLDVARLARYFVKLIGRPISFCIIKPSNFISILK